MAMTVEELAKSVRGTVVGDGSRVVKSCNSLVDATEDQVSLLHLAKYAKELETTRAGCVIVSPGMAKGVTRGDGLPALTVIEAKNTYFAWQVAMETLHGQRKHKYVGISNKAVIDPTAKLGKNVSVHAFAVIGENVVLGDNVHVYPHVTILRDCKVGNDTVLYPKVTLYEECEIGARCEIHAGTVIGSDGTSFAQEGGLHHKMPQKGNVRIEDDVEIAVNSIVERAALKTTVVGKGSKVGSLVIIGHNCTIGAGNMLISNVSIAGSTTTGKYVVMAGQVGVSGHLEIPDFVKIGAQSGVMSNPEPNTEIVGSPAMEAGHAKRVYAIFMNFPELMKRVKELEKKVGEKST